MSISDVASLVGGALLGPPLSEMCKLIIKEAKKVTDFKALSEDLASTMESLVPIINDIVSMQEQSATGIIPKMDPSDTQKELSETFIVPEPKELDISWLEPAFRKLKMVLLEDGEVTIMVVSAPSACGKTTLVTKLCHDTDIKGKFKHIFFITVSKSPNTSIMLNILRQHTACKANEIENNVDARVCIEQVLKQLGPSGSILVVLDDVWPGEEYLVKKFLIQLKDYKILVTSRFEFQSLGPAFQLESFINEDVKNLFTESTLQPPNSLSCTNRDHLLQKIFSGSPFEVNHPCSICDGCNSLIEDGRLVNVLGVFWHPDCFCCDACHKPISIDEIGNHVSNRRGKFHKSCYREMRTCVVCKEKIPSTAEGIKYHEHPFWEGKYCPSHDLDGTPKCYSCERLERKGTEYEMLRDGRWLCPECMDSATMDIYACHLHLEIREFFEGLYMKVEQDFPVCLVEYEVVNETLEERVDLYAKAVTRGICLSEEIIETSVSEVTAILILRGLPRFLTGYILAHEMMHAYLRINGYRNLDNVLEEGLCQVVALMWLESQTEVSTDASAASSSHTPPAASSKTGKWSYFEKKLLEFCKVQIKTDEGVLGVGFRQVYEMVRNSSFHETLEEIIRPR